MTSRSCYKCRVDCLDTNIHEKKHSKTMNIIKTLQCTMQQGLTFLEGGGGFTDKTSLKILVFMNAMIFAFTTFVKNTPLYGKWLLKSISKYLTSFFLDAANI